VNESQLEFWVNTTMAMFYEREPWRSEFGRAMMLMGPPVGSTTFDFAGPGRRTRLAFGTGIHLNFANGISLTAFHDQPDQPYRLSPPSNRLLKELSGQGPAVVDEMRSGGEPTLWVSDASFVDPVNPGRCLLRCLAATPARQGRESWRETTVTFRLLDREGKTIAIGSPTLSESNQPELEDGKSAELWRTISRLDESDRYAAR
jgi:hypothetical protein